ncbi:unnamed protein product [Closterium sp. NIES-54]
MRRLKTFTPSPSPPLSTPITLLLFPHSESLSLPSPPPHLPAPLPHSPAAPVKPPQRAWNCSISRGMWVPSRRLPRYNGASCPFIRPSHNCRRQGRTNFDYQKLQWWVSHVLGYSHKLDGDLVTAGTEAAEELRLPEAAVAGELGLVYKTMVCCSQGGRTLYCKKLQWRVHLGDWTASRDWSTWLIAATAEACGLVLEGQKLQWRVSRCRSSGSASSSASNNKTGGKTARSDSTTSPEPFLSGETNTDRAPHSAPPHI